MNHLARRDFRSHSPRPRPHVVLMTTLMLVAACSLSTWADLARDVQRAIQESDLRDVTIAVSIEDAERSRSLVALRANEALIPASNFKVLTTGTALHVLGPTFSFSTQLLYDGSRLTVVGDGDPGFGDPDLLALLQVGAQEGVSLQAFLDLWIQPIVARGITHLDAIIVDDRIFDRELIHPSWPREQLNRRYCAEVAGFNFHLNLLSFYPQAVPGGQPELSNFEPHVRWLNLTRNTATSNAKQGNTIAIARPFNTNNLSFYGNVRSTMTVPAQVTVHDMPDFFARLLKESLEARGITVATARAAASDDPAPRGDVIAPIVRTPLATAITRCNRDSQNMYAEALLKRAGAALTSQTQPGSFSNGAAAVQMVVHERLGERELLEPLVVADGSGLSRENRVSAALITAWLNSFHQDAELGLVFRDSLAVGGMSGTLEKRFNTPDFAGVRVYGKSGHIDGVSCLSGYVVIEGGATRSFSILCNDVPKSQVLAAKRLQERIVKLIAESMYAEAVVNVGG
ncbi:MAG: D-alanyl-D-alanine carboxypeptidase/D-alanyl-D-alanine endopeptidase [Phycisphaerales bacterium]